MITDLMTLPSDAPPPRLCTVEKKDGETEYGYNLHAEKGRQFVGIVDPGLPAHRGGILQGDRIYAVNGTSIIGLNHKQVVELIRANPQKCELLVVSPEEESWYADHNIPINLDLPNIVRVGEDRNKDGSGSPPPNGSWYAPAQGKKHQRSSAHWNPSRSGSEERSLCSFHFPSPMLSWLRDLLTYFYLSFWAVFGRRQIQNDEEEEEDVEENNEELRHHQHPEAPTNHESHAKSMPEPQQPHWNEPLHADVHHGADMDRNSPRGYTNDSINHHKKQHHSPSAHLNRHGEEHHMSYYPSGTPSDHLNHHGADHRYHHEHHVRHFPSGTPSDHLNHHGADHRYHHEHHVRHSPSGTPSDHLNHHGADHRTHHEHHMKYSPSGTPSDQLNHHGADHRYHHEHHVRRSPSGTPSDYSDNYEHQMKYSPRGSPRHHSPMYQQQVSPRNRPSERRERYSPRRHTNRAHNSHRSRHEPYSMCNDCTNEILDYQPNMIYVKLPLLYCDHCSTPKRSPKPVSPAPSTPSTIEVVNDEELQDLLKREGEMSSVIDDVPSREIQEKIPTKKTTPLPETESPAPSTPSTIEVVSEEELRDILKRDGEMSSIIDDVPSREIQEKIPTEKTTPLPETVSPAPSTPSTIENVSEEELRDLLKRDGEMSSIIDDVPSREIVFTQELSPSPIADSPKPPSPVEPPRSPTPSIEEGIILPDENMRVDVFVPEFSLEKTPEVEPVDLLHKPTTFVEDDSQVRHVEAQDEVTSKVIPVEPVQHEHVKSMHSEPVAEHIHPVEVLSDISLRPDSPREIPEETPEVMQPSDVLEEPEKVLIDHETPIIQKEITKRFTPDEIFEKTPEIVETPRKEKKPIEVKPPTPIPDYYTPLPSPKIHLAPRVEHVDSRNDVNGRLTDVTVLVRVKKPQRRVEAETTRDEMNDNDGASIVLKDNGKQRRLQQQQQQRTVEVFLEVTTRRPDHLTHGRPPRVIEQILRSTTEITFGQPQAKMEHLAEDERSAIMRLDECIGDEDGTIRKMKPAEEVVKTRFRPIKSEYTEPAVFNAPPPPDADAMTPKPLPRLANLEKSTAVDEFGFNLHAEKNQGHFIGTVDVGGIAEQAGLRMGQRIVGVNHQNIYPNTPHKEVVQLIKKYPLQATLLVASEDVDSWYRTHGVEYSFEEAEPYGIQHNGSQNHHEDVKPHSASQNHQQLSPHSIQVGQEVEVNVHEHKNEEPVVLEPVKQAAQIPVPAHDPYTDVVATDDLIDQVFSKVTIPTVTPAAAAKPDEAYFHDDLHKTTNDQAYFHDELHKAPSVEVTSTTVSDSLGGSLSSFASTCIKEPPYVPSYGTTTNGVVHQSTITNDHQVPAVHDQHFPSPPQHENQRREAQQPSPLSNASSSNGYATSLGSGSVGYDDDIYHLSAKEARERLRNKNKKNRVHDMTLNEKYQLISNL